MTKTILQKLTLALALTTLSAMSATAVAAYPERPITLVVGFAAGGTADFTGRMVADAMGKRLGQTVVVENRGGANGNLATNQVLRAEPDGYTIFLAAIGHAVNPFLYKNVKYDPVKDFTAIGNILSVPTVLVVPGNSEFKNVKDLVAYAKAHPGKLNYASAGFGSAVHLSMELFLQLSNTKMTHIPYKGTGPAMSDLLAGTVQLAFTGLPPAMPQIKSGGLRALGVSSKTRSSAAPDIPTLDEEGVKGYNMAMWYGLVGPAKMSPDIVKRLNAALNESLADPAVKAKLASQGAESEVGTPEQFNKFLEDEAEKWAKLIKESKLQMD